MSCSSKQWPFGGKLCLNVHNINAITWKTEQNLVHQLVILSSGCQIIRPTVFFSPLNWQVWVVFLLVSFPCTSVSLRRTLHLQARRPSPKLAGMFFPSAPPDEILYVLVGLPNGFFFQRGLSLPTKLQLCNSKVRLWHLWYSLCLFWPHNNR